MRSTVEGTEAPPVTAPRTVANGPRLIASRPAERVVSNAPWPVSVYGPPGPTAMPPGPEKERSRLTRKLPAFAVLLAACSIGDSPEGAAGATPVAPTPTSVRVAASVARTVVRRRMRIQYVLSCGCHFVR